MRKILNIGHLMQIVWLITGIILQTWIGGVKGLVVIISGAIIILIPSLKITYLEKDIDLLRQNMR